jgi:hypothetical protein
VYLHTGTYPSQQHDKTQRPQWWGHPRAKDSVTAKTVSLRTPKSPASSVVGDTSFEIWPDSLYKIFNARFLHQAKKFTPAKRMKRHIAPQYDKVLTVASVKTAVFTSQRYLLHHPDDGGGKYVRNAGNLLPDYTALQLSRQPSSNFTLKTTVFWV